MSDKFDDKHTCSVEASQLAKVCLPVVVKPFSVTGPAKVRCYGRPEIRPDCDRCPGKVNGKCEFTVSQLIRVELPVEFGANVEVGETYVDCECVDLKEHKDCDYCD